MYNVITMSEIIRETLPEEKETEIRRDNFGWLGRIPVALYIGGIPTIVVGSIEYATEGTLGVAIAGGFATALGVIFNRTTLNDPIPTKESPRAAADEQASEQPPLHAPENEDLTQHTPHSKELY